MADPNENPAFALLSAHDIQDLAAAIRSQTIVQLRVERQHIELLEVLRSIASGIAEIPQLRREASEMLVVMQHKLGNGSTVDGG